MTREEAIKILKAISVYECYPKSASEETKKALDMAIEALQEPKIIVGIDTPYGSDKGIATLFKGKDDKLILEDIKEVISVVRCKDCRFNKHPLNDLCLIKKAGIYPDDDDFCSYGKRREK